MNSFIVQPEESNMRLDKFLNEKLADMTRSQIQKLIERGFVTVNGKQPSVHKFLKNGDEISVTQPDIAPPPPVPKLTVIAETDDYVVINKPAGILTHSATASPDAPTVTSWALQQYPHIAEVGDPGRPGIVHRLDKDTSGVLVIAKTQAMYDSLKRQFHDREVEKTYLALVEGHLATENGSIDKPIGRSKQHHRMAARTTQLDDRDREAVTEYQVINRFQKRDYVEVHPKTGRTHQIRVHLYSLGNPVVGDTLYKIRAIKPDTTLGRLFLHAAKLRFSDLAGERVSVSAPLPKELKHYLDSQK